MPRDTDIQNLIINKLTKQQFDGIQNPDPTQLYFVTDEGDSISDLDDVSLSDLQNGQVLKWNATTRKWENAASGGGSVDIDNLSITENSSFRIQTVGVIDSNDNETAIKTWIGTREEYEALIEAGEIDDDTLYTITDDVDVPAMYPTRNVGQIVTSTIPLIDAGLHLLDGSLINGNGIYKEFVDYIADRYEEDPTANYFMQPQIQANVIKFGNLVEENGVLSNFTSSNYAQLPQVFSPGDNTWELGMKVTTGETVITETSQCMFTQAFNNLSSLTCRVIIHYTGYFQLWLGTGTTTWDIASGVTGTHAVQPYTTYWLKVIFDGTSYKLYYSLDGENYVEDVSVTSSTSIGSFQPYLGDYVGETGSYDYTFKGSMDLKEFYINVDDQLWWTGIYGGNFIQPNMTSNGILGGSTFAVTSVGNMLSDTEPYYAFTRDKDYAYVGGATPSLIFYNPDPLKVSQLNIEWRSPSSQNPHTINVNVYGSNDNETWAPLVSNVGDTNEGASYGSSYLLINLTNNSNYYKYYKIEDTIPYVNPSTGISYGWLVHYVSIVARTSVPYVAPSAEDAWQAQVAEYGVCGKFVYDPEANTVRLPKITGFVEGASGVHNLGDLVQAGLPNITGTFDADYLTSPGTVANVTGAFYDAGVGSKYGSSGATGNTDVLGLDASLSNNIYGNSTTVQPQAIKVLYYIVVATSAKTDIQIDIDNVVADLNDIRDKINDGINTALFDVVPKDHILSYEESKGLAQLGSYVYKEAVPGSRYGYADFYSKCLEEYQDENNTTEYLVDFVGSLTNNDGVVSGFSTEPAYVHMINDFRPLDNSWEINIKFTTGAVNTEQYIIAGNPPVGGGCLDFRITNSKFGLALSSCYYRFDIFNSEGSYTVQANTTYWVKIAFSGTQYTLAYSMDGTTYTTDITVSSSTLIYQYTPLMFGIDWNGDNFRVPFLGSIDFNNTYITVNNRIWWNPLTLITKNSNGHRFYNIEDKELIDNVYSTRKEAWFYGIDEASERIFLPRSTRIKFAGLEEVSKYQEAGLPNITGWFYADDNGPSAGGALQYNSGGGHGLEVAGSGNGTVTFDASRSSAIYGNSSTVEYSSTKMIPYMVVGNTNAETAATDIVDVTTTENDTLPLFTGMYFDVKPNNVSWVLAGGQVAKGTVYTFAYNELLHELTTPKYNLQVIREEDMQVGVDYSEYWVVNEDQEYFICPTKLSYGAYNMSGSINIPVSVKGTGKALGLTVGSGKNTGLCLLDGNEMRITMNAYGANNGAEVGQADLSSITRWTATGVTTDATKSGLTGTGSIDLSSKQSSAKLYFKVANAVQNLEVLDAGAVLEAVNDLIPDNSDVIVNYGMPSDRYDELVVGVSGATYTAPANGWFVCRTLGRAIDLIGKVRSEVQPLNSSNKVTAYIPVTKGETIVYSYAEGSQIFFRFVYANGSENEA